MVIINKVLRSIRLCDVRISRVSIFTIFKGEMSLAREIELAHSLKKKN